VYEIYAKHIFGGNIYVLSKFSRLTTWPHAHAHCLEGTLVKNKFLYYTGKDNSISNYLNLF